MATRLSIGQMLLEKGLVEKRHIERALEYQQKSGENLKLGEILVKFGFVTQRDILECIGEQFDIPVVDLRQAKPAVEAVDLVPRNTAKMHNIMPLRMEGHALIVAIDDLDLCTIDNLKFVLDMEIKPVLAPAEDIAEAIERYYGGEESTVDNMLREFTESDISYAEMTGHELSGASGLSELSEISEMSELSGAELEGGGEGKVRRTKPGSEAAIVRLVNLIITEAVRARASDIHVEPLTNRLRVRYRIDGVCQEIESPPKRLQSSLIARARH